MDDQESTTIILHPLPGFPGYTTIRELGSGGMARVYLAKDEALDRLVAIKVMNIELLSPEYLARFDGEAKTAAQFRHPNIVGVFASGQVGGRPYIAFEYAPGGTLETRLQQSKLPERRTLEIAKKLARALAYLHERKIIHRDLKPANIVFNDEDEPLLSDFGIAKAVETDAGLTQPGTAIGSPRYMSPEHLRGEQITEKSDSYGFGLLLLEMLRGELRPTDVQNLASLDVGRCTKLVVACLASDPEQRPSAADCVTQLNQLIRVAAKPRVTKLMVLGAGLVLCTSLVLLFAYRSKLIDLAPSESESNVQLTSTIALVPSHAKLYVDGNSLPILDDALLPPGYHELLAVAAGYSGYFATIEAKPGSEIEIELVPLTLPSLDQFQAFHGAFDDVAIGGSTRAPTAAVEYALYDELLALEAHLVSPDPAQANEQLQRLLKLADAGDAPAQVAVFLLASERLGGVDTESAAEGLRVASTSGGFALATYYRALALRQELEAAGSIDAQSLAQLAELMRLAFDQGLEFVAAELRLIQQLEIGS